MAFYWNGDHHYFDYNVCSNLTENDLTCEVPLILEELIIDVYKVPSKYTRNK
jgi:hypothetical protein